jgi:hypothetical protein
MLFMLPNVPEPNADWTPSVEAVEEMMKFNQEMSNAGILLALDGLRPQTEGVRVTSENGKQRVIDGPFTEAKEVIGGYWLIDVKSKEEAVEWAKRVPQDNCSIEVRQIYEIEEFPPDVQAAAGEFKL